MPPAAAVGQRALSTLAKKLHPQLPLTPRESQQLLGLLTTSFRLHLDREHPVHTTEVPVTHSTVPKAARHDPGTTIPTSSAALASQHLDAVLSNPLFAMKPARRGSRSGASQVLKDPIGWFLNEITLGSATLSSLSTCLNALDTSGTATQPHRDKTPGAIIGAWLRSSGLDTSKEFLETCVASKYFLSRLVTRLLVDGETRLLWKWFARTSYTSSSPRTALLFRKQLLRRMVLVQAHHDLPQSLLLFKKALDTCKEQRKGFESLIPAGQELVKAITNSPNAPISNEVYDAFRESVTLWVPGSWALVVDAMMWLHHPTGASSTPGLQFIQDPAGAAKYASVRPGQRSFVVQLGLGVARELLAAEQYEDAQAVMAFVKKYFPDLVLPDSSHEQTKFGVQSTDSEKAQTEEERNLELLDGLLPT
ncbi:hypothetical protein G6514_000314 [Epicoccum nigrum]|nr:hypothetical protein G6514_000314 [Epicoccum nigrum]